MGVLLFFALLLLPAQWVEAGTRRALVVGVSNYEAWTPLRNALHDARAVAQRLKSIGFEVRDRWVVTDGKRDEIDNAVLDFLGELQPGDEAVMFFSGHGVQVGGAAILVPRDMPDVTRYPGGRPIPPERIGDAEDMLKRGGIDLAGVAQRVALRVARRVGEDDERGFSLLIVDACRDNPVLDALIGLHRQSPTKSLQPPPQAGVSFNPDPATRNQVLWFSARSGQTSLDRLPDDPPGERNGVFTRVLLKELERPDRPLRELINAVERDVPRLAQRYAPRGRPHQQEPVSHASANRSEFNFKRGVIAARMQGLGQPTRDAEEEAWELARQRDTVPAYRAYLGQYPQGRYAAAARVATAGLNPEPRPAPSTGPVAAVDGKEVYDSNCRVCHATGVAGAPVYGEKITWMRLAMAGGARIPSDGIDWLVKRSIDGLRAMPPRGGNAKLTDAEVRAAVEYMLTPLR